LREGTDHWPHSILPLYFVTLTFFSSSSSEFPSPFSQLGVPGRTELKEKDLVTAAETAPQITVSFSYCDQTHLTMLE
jgi:hypothetical protein